MSRVRVWDRDQKWLWPNLPYLLRAFGIEREQRYGGVDPGHGVDNDFAAVVVKRIPNEDAENPTTVEPIGTVAEWHAPDAGWIDKRTIVHDAVSEDILWSLPLGEQAIGGTGRLGIWLIYADFLESPAPRGWPEEPEFAGGALAYFSLRWRIDDDEEFKIDSIDSQIPPANTGVDWPSWQDENVK